LCLHLSAALFVAGALVLLLRLFFDQPVAHAAWWYLLALSAFVTAARFARPRYLSAASVGALLDRRAGAGGEIVAHLEHQGEDFERRAARLLAQGGAGLGALPRLRRRLFFGPVIPALAFAVAVLWVDISPDAMGFSSREVFDASLRQAAEKLATLQEVVDLEEELASELEQRLERIEAEVGTERPESTFEALDRLEERLQAEAARTEESAEAAREALNSAEFQQAFHEGTAEEVLERTLQDLGRNGLDQSLPESLQALLPGPGLELPEGFSLEPAEVAKLSKELLAMLGGKLALLEDAKLLKPGDLKDLADWKPAKLCEHDEHDPGGT
jgi:hypothetical protein